MNNGTRFAICCFNSRAREGRDVVFSLIDDGADMFQLTRPRGARPLVGRHPGGAQGFNSRAREGRDSVMTSFRSGGWCFNSRAREGRDDARRVAKERGMGFNSRAREGRDCSMSMRHARRRSFNSRAREGRDSIYNHTNINRGRFNSRAREGRDLADELPGDPEAVSTHAPARGATPPSTPSRAPQEFQLTRPRGARHHLHVKAQHLRVSTHAPARGATFQRRGHSP